MAPETGQEALLVLPCEFMLPDAHHAPAGAAEGAGDVWDPRLSSGFQSVLILERTVAMNCSASPSRIPEGGGMT